MSQLSRIWLHCLGFTGGCRGAGLPIWAPRIGHRPSSCVTLATYRMAFSSPRGVSYIWAIQVTPLVLHHCSSRVCRLRQAMTKILWKFASLYSERKVVKRPSLRDFDSSSCLDEITER